MKLQLNIKSILTCILSVCFLFQEIKAQTNTFPSTGAAGIGTTTPNTSAALDITSTTQGMLVPRMTKNQRDAIASPATGLMIYQTNNTLGFYYYSGTAWTAVSPKGVNKSLSNLSAPTAINTDLLPGNNNSNDLGSYSNLWRDLYLGGSVYLSGNIDLKSGSVIAANGTTVFNSDASNYNLFTGNASGINNTSGNYNTATGALSLSNNSTGFGNSASGAQALLNNVIGGRNTANGIDALFSNSTGNDNTGNGAYTLFANNAGNNNTANGSQSLYSNTNGYSNVGIGVSALYNNITGHNLVAVGDSALYNQVVNSSSNYANTAIGSKALYSNTTGPENTAIGYQALYSNSTGDENTATGYQALYSNTGEWNMGNGYQALYSNTSGYFNTADGNRALYSNTTGSSNTANGDYAQSSNTTGTRNTAVGGNTLITNSTGSNITVLGWGADVTTDGFINEMALGYNAKVNASNKVVVGNSSVTSIGGQVGWSTFSDGRFKTNIKGNVPGLLFINKLQPVTYTVELRKFDKFLGIKDSMINSMASEYDKNEKKIRTGFIAQDVEKAAQQTDYDFDGVNHPQSDKDNYSLDYADFVPSLVKAVQQLSVKNDSLQDQNKSQQSEIDNLQNQINQLRSILTSSSSVCVDNQKSTEQTIDLGMQATLSQNIPNPFDGITTINYFLPLNSGNAYISFTNSTGQVLKQQKLSGNGKGIINIKANELSSGIYQYSLIVDGKIISTKQMVLVK